MNTTSTNTTNLPSRLKESSFRRYENVIAQIVDVYPRAVKIHHGDLSPSTFSARLRDAIKSLIDNKWTTIIKCDSSLLSDIVVSQRSNGIFAGTRDSIRCLELDVELGWSIETNVIDAEPSFNEISSLELNNLTRDEVKFLCLLASKSAFTRPIELTAEWMDDENLEWFLGNFDVILERSKDVTKRHTFTLT